MPIISDLGKIEGRLMAHFEATMMLIVASNPNLAIKWERKVLETPFWYQTKGLQEQSLNKLFWQQIHIHKVSKSPKNTIFGSKTAISRPLINLKMTTFSIKPTPKILLALYTTPTNTISSYENLRSLVF